MMILIVAILFTVGLYLNFETLTSFRFIFTNNFKIAEDFGAAVANIMAQIYPYRVGGIHLTMPAHPLNSAIPLFYGILFKEIKNDFSLLC